MKCDRLNKLYDLYRYGLLHERSNRQIEEHLASCSSCQKSYEENDRLSALIRETSRPSEPYPQYFQILASQTIQRLREKSPRDPWFGIRRWWAAGLDATRFWREAFIGAACLLIGVLGMGIWNSQSASNLAEVAPPPMEIEIAAVTSPGPLMPSPDTIDKGVQNQETGNTISGTLLTEAGLVTKGGSDVPALLVLDGQALQQLSQHLTAALSYLPSSPPTAPEQIQAPRDPDPTTLVSLAQPAPQLPAVSDTRWLTVFDQLEDFKWQLYQSGHLDEYHSTIRKLASNISDVPGVSAPTAVLQQYHLAEDAMLEGNYFDALQKYNQIIRQYPETMLSALSRFQMAGLYCELMEFEDAFSLYKQCILSDEKYLSRERSDVILKRIQMIADNEQDDYRPLRLFFKAGRSASYDAIDYYEELLDDYPESSLVESTIANVRQLAIYPERSTEPPVSAQRVLATLKQIRDLREDDPVAIQAQMALADVIFYRMQNLEQASFEYKRIFDMTDDPQILARARRQVNNLTILELLGNE